MDAIKRAIEIVGSQNALARIIGCPQSMVCEWNSGRRPIPAKWCPLIEDATDGAVTCEDMNSRFIWDRDESGAVVGCRVSLDVTKAA